MAGDVENGMEMKAHEKGYDLFLGIVKWGTIISGIVAFIVVFFIIA